MGSRNFLMTLFSKEQKAPAQGGGLRGRVGVVTHSTGREDSHCLPRDCFKCSQVVGYKHDKLLVKSSRQ